ncbi:MAG: ABC transporter substrate-binding protein [Rhodospirillales bacterium]
MSSIQISIACGDYDRVRAIKDGRVRVDGCDVTFIPMIPEELFFRALRYAEFDVAELSFNSTMMLTARGVCPYVAIPVFPSRMFRHSAIYVRTDRGITKPEDLKGRLVGVPEYQQTANVWMRGILADEYGVKDSDIRWRSGGQEEAGRDERTPLALENGVELIAVKDRSLSAMLLAGDLDAFMTARAPSVFLDRRPNIGRLWPDYRTVELDYYRRTGIFPIMHLIGVKRTLAEKHPWLPGSLYKAFNQAKAIAMQEIPEVAALNVTLPWVEVFQEEVQRLMGDDYWRYGIAECRHEIETLMRYSHAQGLLPRPLTVEELFCESTFELSKI